MTRALTYLGHKAPQSRVEQHLMQASGAALAGIPSGSLQVVVPITLGGGLSIVNGVLTMGAGGPYVLKTGDTMSGDLTFTQPSGIVFANGQEIYDNSNAGLAIYVPNHKLQLYGGDVTNGAIELYTASTLRASISNVGIANFATTEFVTAGWGSTGGLEYRNRIWNHSHLVDQINGGAAYTVLAGGYLHDGWVGFGMAASGVFTSALANETTDGYRSTNYHRLTVTTADASIATTDRYLIQHRMEGYAVFDFNFGSANALPFTISFKVRSSKTGTFCLSLLNSPGDRHYVTDITINAINTWERKTVTITPDTTGTWVSGNGLGLVVAITLASNDATPATANTWGAGNKCNTSAQSNFMTPINTTFDLKEWKLEPGTVATPYTRQSYPEALAQCYRSYVLLSGTNDHLFGGDAAGAYTQYVTHTTPVPMRATPIVTKNGTWGVLNCAQPTVAGTSPTRYYTYTTAVGAGQWYFQMNGAGQTLTLDARL
jgi:hypothetical protein